MDWILPPERYPEIEESVVDFVEDWGISDYPFSLWSLLRKMRIECVAYSSLEGDPRSSLLALSEDAVTIHPFDFNPNGTSVYYNDEGRERERVRFTIAHELGHVVLGHGDEPDDVREREANFFAGYLLAPIPLILKYSDPRCVEAVHDAFAISYGCARSACADALRRLHWGPARWRGYERRILDCCRPVEGGGQLALLK